MPPHCDARDGPVVKAAMRALEEEDVDLVLPFVHDAGEDDVRRAFELVVKGRKQGPEAQVVCDDWFFETVVRIHRAGEGAPYTGLKPAGLDTGPAIPRAEAAIASGDPDALVGFFLRSVDGEMRRRFAHLMEIGRRTDPLRSRAYVQDMLGFEVGSHKLYKAIKASAHDAA